MRVGWLGIEDGGALLLLVIGADAVLVVLVEAVMVGYICV